MVFNLAWFLGFERMQVKGWMGGKGDKERHAVRLKGKGARLAKANQGYGVFFWKSCLSNNSINIAINVTVIQKIHNMTENVVNCF